MPALANIELSTSRCTHEPPDYSFFVFEPRALVLHAALLVVTAVVAALYPIWLAVKLPIARTLRQEIVS